MPSNRDSLIAFGIINCTSHMSVYFALVLSVACSTLSQVAQKYVAISRPKNNRSMLINPTFWLAMGLLAISMGFWIYVLANLDVGKAYPMLSINYVIMLVLSRLIFKEIIPVPRLFGILLIVSGVVLIGWS